MDTLFKFDRAMFSGVFIRGVGIVHAAGLMPCNRKGIQGVVEVRD